MTAQITLNKDQIEKLIVAANTTKEKTYFIAKDQGAYLGAGQKETQVLYYFKGCNPEINKDLWYDEASYKFGGDDFGEILPIVVIEDLIKKGFYTITWLVGKTKVSIQGKKPRVEVPKVEIPKVEVPKVEIPKVEVPKVEIPAIESKGKSIKILACELLCKVRSTSKEGRSIGFSYTDILNVILEQKPEAKTSLSCLRWYAAKIRVAANGYFEYKLPQLRVRNKADGVEEA